MGSHKGQYAYYELEKIDCAHPNPAVQDASKTGQLH
jgi:hypothetical protein